MPSDVMRVWRDELAYAIKLADWAAGEGFCEIEGLQDPDEWCCQMWQELGPPNGDGYTADALAAAVIERAIADAVEQERARIVAIAKQYADNPVGPGLAWDEQQAGWYETGAVDNILAFIANVERGDHKERADG